MTETNNTVDIEVEEDLSKDPELKAVLDHMNSLKGKVSVYDLDFLIAKMQDMELRQEEVAKATTRLNKIVARIQAITGEVLRDLERTEYVSPKGKLAIVRKTNIKMPETRADKDKLFDWMRSKDIYDTYATVHANKLKSLFMEEMAIARREQGEEFDEITFSLPGMEPATFFEHVDFKPTRKKSEK